MLLNFAFCGSFEFPAPVDGWLAHFFSLGRLGLRTLAFCQLGNALLFLLLILSRDEFLKGTHFHGARHSEALEIDLFDELWERKLPRLLAMVGQSAKLLGVEPQLSCHLYLSICEVETLSRFEPRQQLLWNMGPRHGKKDIPKRDAAVKRFAGECKLVGRSSQAAYRITSSSAVLSVRASSVSMRAITASSMRYSRHA